MMMAIIQVAIEMAKSLKIPKQEMYNLLKEWKFQIDCQLRGDTKER